MLAEHLKAPVGVDAAAPGRRDRERALEREGRMRGRAGGGRSRRAGLRARRGRGRPPRPRRAWQGPSRASTRMRAGPRALGPAGRDGGGCARHAGGGERHVPAVDLAKCIHARAILEEVERRLIAGQSPFEPVAGFSRAVVAGRPVSVAGTAPIPADGSPPPESAYEQARLCLSIIAEALDRAGAVARARRAHADLHHRPAVLERGRARARRACSRDISPAATCVVCALLDPSWKVEIEADAVLP